MIWQQKMRKDTNTEHVHTSKTAECWVSLSYDEVFWGLGIIPVFINSKNAMEKKFS